MRAGWLSPRSSPRKRGSRGTGRSNRGALGPRFRGDEREISLCLRGDERSLVRSLRAELSYQPSCDAAENEGRVVARVDAQPYAAPFEQQALAGRQILHFAHRLPGLARADVLVAEVHPEFLRPVCDRDGAGDRVVAADRLLQEANDIVIVDLQELQFGGLLQRAVLAPDLVQPADIILDVARRVPVARLDLVFFGVEKFFAPRERLV